MAVFRIERTRDYTMSWQLWLPAHSCDFETDFKERRTLMSQLTQCCPQTTTDELVDIREVTVDKDLPKEERIAAFLHQIKNPYRFRCGDFVVNAAFASNGVTLEECLQGILRYKQTWSMWKQWSQELRRASIIKQKRL